MNYIKVEWTHSFATEPVLLFSELDKDRWEIRKVEVYRDGHCEFADAKESFGSAMLSKVPIPPLSEIATDPQFDPMEITRDEFEIAWTERRGNTSQKR